MRGSSTLGPYSAQFSCACNEMQLVSYKSKVLSSDSHRMHGELLSMIPVSNALLQLPQTIINNYFVFINLLQLQF